MSRYFSDFGDEMPSWTNVTGQTPASAEPSSGYVGPGSATGWTSDTAVPYSQPYVRDVPTGSAQSTGVMDVLTSLAGGLVNIFGQRVNPQGQVVVQQKTPGWVMPVAIVGGVIVLGSVFMAGKGRRMNGYRRSRRSRR